MGLSIKRVETERKARAVAERMGVGLTEAIDMALDRTWKELNADDAAAERARKREALFARIQLRGAGNGKSLQEIEDEMYDEHGLPR
ncbi:type II toxin-antitoxin system VapB family antitoxin [Brevundimonas sp. PAMC22021]|uniref:type II toxin-antitoxin system VapB family antitoxin n=1 Tax=Brevundimonas sp. PAMC22021 TaxID=2861285 RepID=UPI001C6260C2|nr:type II toxin-antitoxin system VapB family antitoxin [Brevundimonas sp. PAMC22021]QYF86382.1 type II toxin-antitoxin system VapB family antitoxin [Brevundimonas sp. PAMC22021]